MLGKKLCRLTTLKCRYIDFDKTDYRLSWYVHLEGIHFIDDEECRNRFQKAE